MSKGEDDLDPNGYRSLAILSVCYRIWGVATLRRSSSWVQSWQTDDLFAGTTAPLGAEDAWYIVNLQFEDAKLQGQQISGGSADIYKFFEQIQLWMLVCLLELAGFPPGPLRAYADFYSSCLFYNTVAGGLGEPHLHPCSTPQGCP